VAGPLHLPLRWGHGSFAFSPLGSADFGGGIGVGMVDLDGSGSAEVRGLTADGVSSRWGAATRSPADKASWNGQDFEICAWARGEANPSGNAHSATAAKAVRPKAGGQCWAVYTAMADDGTAPELRQAEAVLRELGLEMGGTRRGSRRSARAASTNKRGVRAEFSAPAGELGGGPRSPCGSDQQIHSLQVRRSSAML